MARPVICCVRFPTQHPLKRGPEFRTKNCVDDRVQRGVEVPQPEEEDGHHDGKDEERKPASNEGPRHEGQRLGGLPLSLGLQ